MKLISNSYFKNSRFIEITNNKKHIEVTKTVESAMMAWGMLEEFKYLTHALLAMLIEVENCNKMYKIIDNTLKSSITYFKGIIKHQGVNYSKELEKAFSDRLEHFNSTNKNSFITNYKEELEYTVLNVNVLVDIMYIMTTAFAKVVNNLHYKNELIKELDQATEFLIEIKNAVKPKKVSKYQNFVGKNLKNWRG